MRLTAELSLYPLRDDYIPVIDELIADLNRQTGLTVITNAMSTQVAGDYGNVFEAVKNALARSAERFGGQILVCKFIPGDLLTVQG